SPPARARRERTGESCGLLGLEGNQLGLDGRQPARESRGPSGRSTRTPGVPASACAVGAGTTAQPPRSAVPSGPTALIHATGIAAGSAAPPSGSTTSSSASIGTSGVCATPSNRFRCQLFIFVCHSPVLVGPALAPCRGP